MLTQSALLSSSVILKLSLSIPSTFMRVYEACHWIDGWILTQVNNLIYTGRNLQFYSGNLWNSYCKSAKLRYDM